MDSFVPINPLGFWCHYFGLVAVVYAVKLHDGRFGGLLVAIPDISQRRLI